MRLGRWFCKRSTHALPVGDAFPCAPADLGLTLPDFWLCALAVAGFDGAGAFSVVFCDAAAGLPAAGVEEELGRSEKEARSWGAGEGAMAIAVLILKCWETRGYEYTTAMLRARAAIPSKGKGCVV